MQLPEEQLEVLMIGTDLAGLAAGIAAKRAGADVRIVDERQLPGGQYFKQLAVGVPIRPIVSIRKVPVLSMRHEALAFRYARVSITGFSAQTS